VFIYPGGGMTRPCSGSNQAGSIGTGKPSHPSPESMAKQMKLDPRWQRHLSAETDNKKVILLRQNDVAVLKELLWYCYSPHVRWELGDDDVSY
jgi:hypothetical protein